MKVAINARILNTTSIRGWSRYTYNLIEGLNSAGVPVLLFSDTDINEELIPDALKNKTIVQKGRNYSHWEQCVLPRLVSDSKAEIFHCPINYGVPFLGKFKKVITIHDAIDRAYYHPLLPLKERWSFTHQKMKFLHALSHKSCDRVITVSHFSKNQVAHYFNVDPKKIDVIYEGAEEHFNADRVFSEEDLKLRFQQEPGYYFYVGGFEKRKNIEILLGAAKVLQAENFRFVIAGGKFESFIKDAPSNVKFIGYVEEKDLPSLYHYSKGFVYPSFSEGFGLQLVESMSLGRPAVYANTSSLPEVYGSEIWGFDPKSKEDLVKKLRYLDANYEQAVEYVQSRKNFFSWKKTIQETIKVYESILL